MPELPEVEVIRRGIERRVAGRRISRVRITRDSHVFLTRPASLKRVLVGRTVLGIERRGKYLLVGLDDGRRLMFHLGMTGQLIARRAAGRRSGPESRGSSSRPKRSRDPQVDKHTHLILSFGERGPEVLFRDVRKFGRVCLLAAGHSNARLNRLGIDALEASGEDLFQASRGRKVAVKTLLLNQAVIAGVGNIYADEALFQARIRPTRRAGRLTRRDCQVLMGSVTQVLLRAITTGGSSISDFIASDGMSGSYQREHQVYGRGGKPCSACGEAIRKIRVGQRAAHYCPRCQR
jgi:formamidopyrimidine-DNA glycosylase